MVNSVGHATGRSLDQCYLDYYLDGGVHPHPIPLNYPFLTQIPTERIPLSAFYLSPGCQENVTNFHPKIPLLLNFAHAQPVPAQAIP